MRPLLLDRTIRLALSAVVLFCATACYVEFFDDDFPITMHLTASIVSPTAIELFWTPHPGPITGYDLYRNDIAIYPYHLNRTTFLDSGLLPGTRYCYRVYAVVWPFGYDGRSNLACATTPLTELAPVTPLHPVRSAAPVPSTVTLSTNHASASDRAQREPFP